jgi:hypothetical protein
MAIEAYPLTWPAGWKRTRAEDRRYGQFNKKESKWVPGLNGGSGYSSTSTKNLSVTDGVQRVLESLTKMGIDKQDVILSTNVRVRLDGLPRSGEKAPEDPGAAVYWRQTHGAPMRCMAIDSYTNVEDNLAAIAATLEAMRAIERHGGAAILDRAFTGFKALEAQNVGPSWWSVLQLEADATEEQIQQSFRRLAKVAHSDSTFGTDEAMMALNVARDQGLAAARGRG